MDFGKVADHELEGIDFILPPDPEWNTQILKSCNKPFDFRLGAAKWGRQEWVGSLYPNGTTESQFLDEYVKRFNYLELSSTFYQIPRPEQLKLWGGKAAGHDIIVNIKMSQQITHNKRFLNCQSELSSYFDAISEFGSKLGRIWIQASDSLGVSEVDNVLNLLNTLPSEYRYFVEFRNTELFSDKVIFKEIVDFLSAKRIGLIITDTAGRRDLVHMTLTVPETMIRFVGNSDHPSEVKRLESWAERINDWRSQGIETVYFGYDQHDYSNYPKDYKKATEIFTSAGLLT